MEGYIIQPWDSIDPAKGRLIDPDQYIPPEVDSLSETVVTCYDMEVFDKTLITAKPDKGGAIWKINTDHGARALKLLHRQVPRSLFSIYAQEHISKQGGRVPRLIPTKDNELYVHMGGKLWIVTEWIEDLSPAPKNIDGAQALSYGLGEFHKASLGYTPPKRARKACRLYRWPTYYEKIITKFQWFNNLARLYSEAAGSSLLLESLPHFKAQAEDALENLHRSAYQAMVQMGEKYWGLAHQDYGWSNGQMGSGGLWVIDLDGVAYDFPIRDLRKLISGVMDDLGHWDIEYIRAMINAYHQAHPIDRETYDLFLIDLAFPNEFYKHVKEIVFDPAHLMDSFLPGLLNCLLKLEESKASVIAELRSERENYTPKKYADKTPLYSYGQPEKQEGSLEGKHPEWVVSHEVKENNTPRIGKIVNRLNPIRNYVFEWIISPLVENMANSFLGHPQQQKKDSGQIINSGRNKPEWRITGQEGLLPKPQPVYEEKAIGKKGNGHTESKSLNVLMICTEKLPVPPILGGAIQTYIEGVCKILSDYHKITILGTTDPSLKDNEVVDGIHYVRIPGERFFDIYAEGVVEFLKGRSFDLIHIFNRPRLVPLVREAAPHARIVLSMHNDMFNLNKIDPPTANAAISEAERIITISDYVGTVIKNLYPQAESKLRTIYSGVDLTLFTPYENSPSAQKVRQTIRETYGLENKTVILFVGRITMKKGIDILVQAVHELSKTYSDLALVIVGGTWYSENKMTDYVAYVRSLAERCNCPVITTGYVPGDQIHHWFWAGDIFVCPSQWQEPLARVHYEAMAAGLPFVTTKRGGNPEVVINDNGLLVEKPEDPLAFAQTLEQLIANPKLRREMGLNGRRLAEKRFHWNRVAREILDIWENKP